jgi:hypothetical protein
MLGKCEKCGKRFSWSEWYEGAAVCRSCSAKQREGWERRSAQLQLQQRQKRTEAEERRAQEDALSAEWDRKGSEQAPLRKAHEVAIEKRRLEDPSSAWSNLALARFYAGELMGWAEAERTLRDAGESETRAEALVRHCYPDEWTPGSLLLKAADGYLRAIAIGFPSDEMSAVARIEYAELGEELVPSTFSDVRYADLQHRLRSLGAAELAGRPSGTLYAKEAERLLRQLLRKEAGDELRLRRLVLKALNAQGRNVWDGFARPRGWEGKRQVAETRISELETLQRLGIAGSSPLRRSVGLDADMDDAYGPEWPQVRQSILARDAHACVECGGRERLHVHHILPVRQGGDHDPGNLMTLCNACHAANHAHMTA